LLNSLEEGAIICEDEKSKKRIDCLVNYGFAHVGTIKESGINSKMNELQAARG